MTWWAWLLVTWAVFLFALIGFCQVVAWRRGRYGPTTVHVTGATFRPSDEGKLVRMGQDDAMQIQRVVSPTVVVVGKPRRR